MKDNGRVGKKKEVVPTRVWIDKIPTPLTNDLMIVAWKSVAVVLFSPNRGRLSLHLNRRPLDGYPGRYRLSMHVPQWPYCDNNPTAAALASSPAVSCPSLVTHSRLFGGKNNVMVVLFSPARHSFQQNALRRSCMLTASHVAVCCRQSHVRAPFT